jgi:uncharacterized membrane protein YbhN (UPF0104 family)
LTLAALAIASWIVQGWRNERHACLDDRLGGSIGRVMNRFLQLFWPLVGLVAVAVSLGLLYREFQGASLGTEVWANLRRIPPRDLAPAIGSVFVAYAALAWYDRIALRHLGITHISWLFISLSSFASYAIGHTIGASVLSGGMIRLRAYTAKGLNAAQVAVLVALCSLTYGLGVMLIAGLISVFEPQWLSRFGGMLPEVLTTPTTARLVGFALLAVVASYVLGSVFRFKPLTIFGFRLEYPRPGIVGRQLIAAPLELLGCAGIIYFSLPEAGNPGYFAVLGVFIASFSAALASNAPGGLGVFELLFIKAMPGIPQAEVLAALIVFRLFYLLIPLLISLVIVLAFERSKLVEAVRDGESSSSATTSRDLAPRAERENVGVPRAGV